MMITSVEQARKAIQEQKIKVGTTLTDIDGIFEVTKVNPNHDIVVEAVELEVSEDGDLIPTSNTFRWTLVDLIKMEC